MSARVPTAAGPLNGRYELGRLIAEGGMALVYKGRDLLLDRDVAIKVLRPQYATSPEFLDRFRREARLAASLAHPNLVNVFDVGSDSGQHYIVMELLPGRTLKELVTGGPLPLEEAVDLARQVAMGMAFAHRRGLVHRDLKPQNVLLTEDGHAKVGDFGLAQMAETAQLTMPGTVWGTVQYIAPEQAQGQRPDARSDVYALGAIAYELLTGRPPYEGSTPAAIMMKHVYDPPPRVRDLLPTLPAAAERVVERAMAKAPEERYQSMENFARALADLRDAAVAETMVWTTVPGGRRRSAPDVPPATDDRTQGLPPAAPARPAPAPRQPQRGRPARPAPGGTTAVTRVAPATRPRRRTPRWVPAALAGSVLAFFALMGAGAYAARSLLGTPSLLLPRATVTPRPPTPTPLPPTATPIPLIPVPALVGDPLARAQEKLTAAGLKAETVEDFSRDVPAGSVAAQEPPPNTDLETGKTVKLTVSKGPQRVQVPASIGDTIEVATDKLTKAGLAVDRQEEFNNQVGQGLVFAQEPRAGAQADVGSKVTLRVSRGRDQVTVPRVLGLAEAAAREQVQKEDLKPEVTFEPFNSPGIQPGQVFAQDPPPDQRADRGSTVVLKVRRDPTPVPATATPVPPTPTVPPPPSPSTTSARTPTAQSSVSPTRPATTPSPRP